jgi:hypothetical protein
MNRRTLLLAGPALALAVPSAAPAAQDDAAAIRHRMMALFDKPDQPLAVDPIVVSVDYAVAGWTQGDMGGRALLRRDAGAWRIILCSGDGLTTEPLIRQAGATDAVAADLVGRLATAEAAIDPARRARFSLFQGVVPVDDGGHHHGG